MGIEFRDISNPDPLDVLLDEVGLYQTDWVGHEKVIKLKSNEYTIFIKDDGIWTWYNERDFNNLDSDPNLKEELLSILNPQYDPGDKIS